MCFSLEMLFLTDNLLSTQATVSMRDFRASAQNANPCRASTSQDWRYFSNILRSSVMISTLMEEKPADAPTLFHWRTDDLCSWFNLDTEPLSEPENDRRPLLHLRLQQFRRFLSIEEDGVSLQEVEDGSDQFPLVNPARVINDGVAQPWRRN